MIDVIISTYNSEKLLPKSIATLASQKLSHLLNVYIVDDASSDSEYVDMIADMYRKSQTFASIHTFKNSVNRGPGYTKQFGIDRSKELTNSKWIMILDSDDGLYDSYVINKLLVTAEKYPDAAMIAGRAFEETQPLTDVISPSYKNSFTAITGCIIYFHAKMYSRKAIENSGLRIPSARSNEDGVFNIAFKTIYNKPEDIVFIEETLWFVSYNPNSITRGDNSTRKCWSTTNCNEYMDNYIALKDTFKILEKKCLEETGKLPTMNTHKYLVDYFVYKLSIYLHMKEGGCPEIGGELVRMLLYKTYKDVIEKITHSNPMILAEYWKYEDTRLNLWQPAGEFDINKLIRELAKEFDQKRYEELCEKYIKNTP